MGAGPAWKPEEDAELRRLMNYEIPYVEIGKRLGRSEQGVKSRAHHLRFSSRGRAGYLAQKRFAGKPKAPEHAAKIVAASRERWADPEWRDRMLASLRSEETQAKRKATASIALDQSRGFSVPPEKAEEYRFLRITKLLPAREAAAVLGLIPQSTTASKGA